MRSALRLGWPRAARAVAPPAVSPMGLLSPMRWSSCFASWCATSLRAFAFAFASAFALLASARAFSAIARVLIAGSLTRFFSASVRGSVCARRSFGLRECCAPL